MTLDDTGVGLNDLRPENKQLLKMLQNDLAKSTTKWVGYKGRKELLLGKGKFQN